MMFKNSNSCKLLAFFLLVGLSLASCKKKIRGCMDSKSINFNPKAVKDDGSCVTVGIGGQYQGGIVAYYLVPGDPGYDPNQLHGLIISPSDLPNPMAWNNGSDILTNAYLKTIGSGKANTTKIVNVQGNGNYAATACQNYVSNGFGGWHLPSLDELYPLRPNIDTLNITPNVTYWTSSESTINDAWVVRFTNTSGSAFTEPKSFQLSVRPVRSF